MGLLSSISSVLRNPLLDAAMNLGSLAFPPLAMANSFRNMALTAMGGGLIGGLDNLVREMGLPKFIGDLAKNALQETISQHMSPINKEVDDFMNEVGGEHAQSFQSDIMKQFTDAFDKYKSESEKEGAGASAAAGGGGGKSWYVALMSALGEVQNKQAEKLQELSAKVSDSLTGKDASSEERKAEFDAMAEFQAEGKLQDALANLTKSIGDSIGSALATSARSQ